MPIESAVGSASGSGAASASGSTRPQGAATATRAAFSQEEFRSVIWKSTPVREQYGKVARDTKKEPIVSYFDNLEDAQVMVDERGALLGSHARRFRVVVDAILTEADLNFDTALPGARFIDDELVADLDVVVAAIESVDFNVGQTTLLLWGVIGEWELPGGGTAGFPPPDYHERLGKGAAAGGSSASAIAVGVRAAVGSSSGAGEATSESMAAIEGVGSASGASAAAADAYEEGLLLLEGDMQSGTDGLLLEGDAQSGTDRLLFGD